MSFKKYRSKRNLAKSREPPGKKQPPASASLNYCVQKHQARRLHYDFRLEYRGSLLSWAIPKGPSMNPKDKRLAIHVEDHPINYQYFEGSIPPGNYGAGTVEIWDHGTYRGPAATSRRETEDQIEKGLQNGHLDVVLSGDKLNGRYVLQKLKKDPGDSAWLLIKVEDDFASRSEEDSRPKAPLRMKRKAPPGFIAPMLGTLVSEPFDSQQWLFEIKWDGYRALAISTKKQIQLFSRNHHLWNEKFPSIIKELKKIPHDVVLDGELVVLDSKGRSRFHLMQNYQKTGEGALCYEVFDLLFLDGQDLRHFPLIERKERLKSLLDASSLGQIRYSDHVLEKGKAFFKKVSKLQLEGIIGKKLDSTWQSRRSRDWVKIKSALRQEVVIGGFTAPRGSRKKFGALLVGIYQDKELVFAGHVGTGFDATLLQDLYKRMVPLIQDKTPFRDSPESRAAVTWVKPKLVCEVSFAEWTKDNLMRQPVFHGLRNDKPPQSVSKELPVPIDLEEPPGSIKTGNSLVLTNQDKIYWLKSRYTKGDLLDYYRAISPAILPYLKGHPITLHRFPDGIQGEEFYQKNINFPHPAWVKTHPVRHGGKISNYIMISNLKSLLYAINLGSIELHLFLSRAQKLQNPEFCVIDLDPSHISFDKVVETALATHSLLEDIGVKNYCKTSGLRGLHILIPLHGLYDFEQSRQFAEIIVNTIHKQLPAITSLERNPEKREKKVYLDYLQNRKDQTIVSPYSVRPSPLATVSTPLRWEEVDRHLDPKNFTLKTVPDRVKKNGDLLKPLLRNRVDLRAALSKLEKVL